MIGIAQSAAQHYCFDIVIDGAEMGGSDLVFLDEIDEPFVLDPIGEDYLSSNFIDDFCSDSLCDGLTADDLCPASASVSSSGSSLIVIEPDGLVD